MLKWDDKLSVLVSSTCHTDKMVEIQQRRRPIQKPEAIVEYNFGKISVDLSDQMSSCSSALRKSIRWYKNLTIEIPLVADSLEFV